MNDLLHWLADLPTGTLYAVLGAGSALENLVPPVPADSFILLGGFFAGRGALNPWLVFVVTWACNVVSALAVYRLGHRHGHGFFREGWGRHILHEGQMERMQGFYDRWGPWAIFLTRFLPGLRAVVPVFAGVARQRFLPVALPLAVASAIWYGALVWLGATTGRNLDTLLTWLSGANRVLLIVAAAIGVGIGVWWWRSRR